MQSLSPEPLLSEEDYGAIEAAVMETARGRWFLAEYARRNRNADTDAVLSAIRRLERLVHSAGAFDARDEVTRGMADIAQAIAAAQSSPQTLDASAQMIADPEPEMAETVAVIGEEAASGPIVSPAQPDRAETETSAESAVLDQGWEGLDLAAGELAALGLPPELEQAVEKEPAALDEIDAAIVGYGVEPVAGAATTPETIDTSLLPTADMLDEPETAILEAAPEEAVAPSAAAAQAPEPFPILELDEEATDALLTLDVPRQELILPANHLATQRWHRELSGAEEGGVPSHRLDKWAAITAGERLPAVEAVTDAGQDKVLDMVAVVEEALEPAPPPSGLVTFIDEEPVEEEQSIFTAPLRLEPEVGVDKPAPASEPRPIAAAVRPPPRLTIGEIEAMPFARKAALFS